MRQRVWHRLCVLLQRNGDRDGWFDGCEVRRMGKFFTVCFSAAVGVHVLAPGEVQVAVPTDAVAAAADAGEAETAAVPLEYALEAMAPALAQPVSDQHNCLAQAVYFEARGEPLEGHLAVAQVVINRVRDARYPSTVCQVVFQNEQWRHRCQFSFACDGRSDSPSDRRAWRTAQLVSAMAVTGHWEDLTDEATHYHATYVDPHWRYHLMQTVQYGQHVFYREAGS